MGEEVSGTKYISSIARILKFVEIVVLIIAVGAVGFVYDDLGSRDYPKKDNIKVFLAAVAIAGIVAIAALIMFVAGLANQVAALKKVVAAVLAIAGIFLLIGSALLAAAIQYYEDNFVCDALKQSSIYDARCAHLIVGTVFGFIAMVLFIVDAVIHFKM